MVRIEWDVWTNGTLLSVRIDGTEFRPRPRRDLGLGLDSGRTTTGWSPPCSRSGRPTASSRLAAAPRSRSCSVWRLGLRRASTFFCVIACPEMQSPRTGDPERERLSSWLLLNQPQRGQELPFRLQSR
jgi:hypothetical protein